MTENLKTLAELRTEIDLGMTVYPSTNPDIFVRYAEGTYSLEAVLQGGRPMIMGYKTLDDLIADDIASIASQPIWSITKPQALIERMQSWGLEHKEITLDTPFAELGIRSEEFPSAQTLNELVAATQKKAQAQDEYADESIVSLDSQLGRDAAALVEHYFPGSAITGIQSNYHRGVFIGDYSIKMTCAISHPFLQQVMISFNNQDVPSRPDSWQELCSLHIDLFVTRFTLKSPVSDQPITYAIPGMYQEELKKWCDLHDDGGYSSLYGCVETPDMFIITTELLSHSHEEIEHTAKLLAVQAKAKLEKEMRELAESPNSDDPHPF